MTPIKWVYTGALVSKEEAGGDAEFAPVMTLDQIKAWLKNNRIQFVQQDGYSPSLVTAARNHNQVIDVLLAQVQAWRTQGDTR